MRANIERTTDFSKLHEPLTKRGRLALQRAIVAEKAANKCAGCAKRDEGGACCNHCQ